MNPFSGRDPPEMKITLESTNEITTRLGIRCPRCRVWQGTTESGIQVFAFIPLISVHKDEDQTQFERELETVPHVQMAIPLSMII